MALPVIVLSPSKFAISFTLGNACVIAGAGALSGYRAQAAHACGAERAPLAAGYAVSAIGTLWAALVAHSYLLSLLCSAVQVGALAVYVASYLPGGALGARLLLATAARAVGSCVSALARRAPRSTWPRSSQCEAPALSRSVGSQPPCQCFRPERGSARRPHALLC